MDGGADGGGPKVESTVTPDSAPAAAPTVNPDDWLKDIMADGGDRAKAIKTIQAEHPNWNPAEESSALENISPLSSANASSGLVEDKRNAPVGPPLTEDALDKRNAPVGGPPVTTQNLDSSAPEDQGIVKKKMPASIKKTRDEQMELYKSTGAAIKEIEKQIKGKPYKDQGPLKKKLEQLKKMRGKAESYLQTQGML
jgi:hypothetical protein